MLVIVWSLVGHSLPFWKIATTFAYLLLLDQLKIL